MKATLLISASLAAAALAETVVIDGRTVELPNSEVATMLMDTTVRQVFRNKALEMRLRLAKSKIYGGTQAAMEAAALLQKLEKEGPTDANLFAMAELEKKFGLLELSGANSRETRFAAAIANGFDTGLGFKLALADADRNAFTQMLVLVGTAKQAGLVTDATPQVIADIDGKPHTVTTARFIGLMLQYGAYYKGLWDSLKTAD